MFSGAWDTEAANRRSRFLCHHHFSVVFIWSLASSHVENSSVVKIITFIPNQPFGCINYEYCLRGGHECCVDLLCPTVQYQLTMLKYDFNFVLGAVTWTAIAQHWPEGLKLPKSIHGPAHPSSCSGYRNFIFPKLNTVLNLLSCDRGAPQTLCTFFLTTIPLSGLFFSKSEYQHVYRIGITPLLSY